jgi:HNH endonuclease
MSNAAIPPDRKPIPGFESYYSATPAGRIYSERRNIFLRGGVIKNPGSRTSYRRHVLSVRGQSFRSSEHRLVASAFFGPIPQGYVVNHKDGNGLNNQITNLEVVTQQANCIHAWQQLYEDTETIRQVFLDYRAGYSRPDIAFRNNLSEETVEDWLHRKECSDVSITPRDLSLYRDNRILGVALPPDKELDVARLYSTGQYRQRKLVAMFGVDRATIRRIIRKHDVELTP